MRSAACGAWTILETGDNAHGQCDGTVDGEPCSCPCHPFLALAAAIGGGFHPDTRGDAYISLPDGWTAEEVDRVVTAAFVPGLDPYGLALDQLHPTLGRPYSPTDLSSDLIAYLGRTVTVGDVTGVLADVTADGKVTLTDTRSMGVVAILPAVEVEDALGITANRCPRCRRAAWSLEGEAHVVRWMTGKVDVAPLTSDTFSAMTCGGCGLGLANEPGESRLRRADVVDPDLDPETLEADHDQRETLLGIAERLLAEAVR